MYRYRLYVPATDFADTGLRPELLSALSELGYEEPTDIQAETLPPLMAGRDMLGQAATGTGKTAAFALPMLNNLGRASKRRVLTGLVLVPTRELALQVGEAFVRYGKHLDARFVTVYGGAPVRQQIEALKRGVDIVVATPGRALDLIERGSLNLSQVRTVVLDEADEMLDMGFIDEIEAILKHTPDDRQTVLFSATLPARIGALARRHLTDPLRITVARSGDADALAKRVRQIGYQVSRAHKPVALVRILDAHDPTSGIIFCRTRGGVDGLTDRLTARGYQAEALHGGLTQDQRDRVMGRLRANTTELLVATDVAARGLDVEHLTHVINYDLPASTESYVHRIGRVGRAGRDGVAISLVEPRERRMQTDIERLIGRPLEMEQVPTLATIEQARLQRTRDEIDQLLNTDDSRTQLNAMKGILSDLDVDHDITDVALAALTIVHRQLAGPDVEGNDEQFAAVERPAKSGSTKRDRGPSSHKKGGPVAVLFISSGRRAGVTPADLVGALTGEAGLRGKDISDITVHDRYSLVEVPSDRAKAVVTAMRGTSIRGRKATIRLDRGHRARM